MGVAPAMLRPYAPARLRPGRGPHGVSGQPEGAVSAVEQAGGQGVVAAAEVGAFATKVDSPSASTHGSAGQGRESFLAMLQSLDKDPKAPTPETTRPAAKAAKKTTAEAPSKTPRAAVDERTHETAHAEVAQGATKAASKQSAQHLDGPAATNDKFIQWQKQVQNCSACARSQTRASVLLGVGASTQPEWFVLAGAPTRQDEAAGKAWQSSAGRLLEAQLRSIGLDPDTQVYRSYALKCRSDHSSASADSIAACQQVFLQELSWVQPKRLLLLGPEAVQMVFGPQANLAQLRGQLQQWQPKDGHSLPVVVSADPASLLLRPQQKAQAWQDLLLMRQLMHAEPSA